MHPHMHPGMMAWWKHARRAAGACGTACGAEVGRGDMGGGHRHDAHGAHSSGETRHAGGGDDHDGDLGGGSFGVRRPLRFLAFKLDLDEAQVTELARVLNDLKTERAQAAVDHRRTTAAFADAIAADTFDDAKVKAAATGRVTTAERLRDAVAHALSRIHAILAPAQRTKLAYLIRTGVLSL